MFLFLNYPNTECFVSFSKLSIYGMLCVFPKLSKHVVLCVFPKLSRHEMVLPSLNYPNPECCVFFYIMQTQRVVFFTKLFKHSECFVLFLNYPNKKCCFFFSKTIQTQNFFPLHYQNHNFADCSLNIKTRKPGMLSCFP